MKNAVVTGASSGIGEAIVQRLLSLGYHVYGVSRHQSKIFMDNSDYTQLLFDLSSAKETEKLCKFLKGEKLFMLVNCAGFGRFAPHEELSSATIIEMAFVNLSAPMLLTNAVLKSLKKNEGYLINISSVEALRASKFAALYSATKAGLKAFGDALFLETRKSKLSVTNIFPDMTESHFYNDLRFETSSKEDETLYAQDVADALEHILKMRKGAVVSEYTLRSLEFGIVKKSHKTSV